MKKINRRVLVLACCISVLSACSSAGSMTNISNMKSEFEQRNMDLKKDVITNVILVARESAVLSSRVSPLSSSAKDIDMSLNSLTEQAVGIR